MNFKKMAAKTLPLPTNIKKDHLLKAINKIDKEGLPDFHAQSTFYDVLFNKKRYPPKLIVSYANIFANGNEIDRKSFKGGPNYPAFNLLEKQGFQIVEKIKTPNELPRIFIAPRSGEQSAKNFAKTIDGGYKKSDLFEFLSNEDKQGLKGRDVLMVWGNKPSLKARWEKMQEDDWVLFYIHGDIRYAGNLLYKTHNKKLADALWGPQRSENGELVSWEYVYFLKDVEEINIPYREMADYAGYSGSVVQGFQPFSEKGVGNILADHKTIENYLFKTKPLERASKIPMNYKSFLDDLRRSNLFFSDRTVLRFISALCTKPFVILTGLSGSGKTKLAQSFVQWICQSEAQYRIVPVGADWTNREPLLGFPNALNENQYVTPDNGVLELLLSANSYPDLPHFLVLDEMNLSHVERYFADFLSVMESRELIPLHSFGGNSENGIPSEISLPDNLFIIGTVNIDETTYMFSPKVLDRANTIEFRINETEIEAFLKIHKNADVINLNGKGANMAADFLRMSREKAVKSDKQSNNMLLEFFKELKKAGAEFGYRTATEIQVLIHQLAQIEGKLSKDEKLDIAIMQKLLPKLHGSRRKLEPILTTLGRLCISVEMKDEEFKKQYFIKEPAPAFDKDKNIMYPLSFEKIYRMYHSSIDHGFASYAEA